MKKTLVSALLFVLVSCAKDVMKDDDFADENYKIAPYDTTAIDSFSTGAVSVDIARQIKISSQAYQDSLKSVREKVESEKILQKEKEEKEKGAKRAEEDLKKAAVVKLKKEKEKTSQETPPSNNPASN